MILSIVVPCYNEEAVLPETIRRLTTLIAELVDTGTVAIGSHVVLVDDGSKDKTWHLISEAAIQRTDVRGIKLSRNRGHQNAVLAGIFAAEGDAVISIDADLQDDVSAIGKMVEEFHNKNDIVYGIRKSRETDSLLKRVPAEGYYRLLEKFGVEIIFNHADFRLLSRRAIEALRGFGEVNLFLRGIVPQLGFRCSSVHYDRAERFAGESKYPLSKMLGLAWQGITSFSTTPLRMITALGFIISLGSFLVTLWAIGIRLLSDLAVPGWASTVVPIYLLGGVQLLSLGIIGEYIAKIYMETKRRPHYFIEEQV